MSLPTDLSPGIRDLVVFLNNHNFNTVDSGDGSNFKGGMDCAVNFPMVAIRVDPIMLIDEANRLYNLLKEHGVDFIPTTDDCNSEVNYPAIQASFDPENGYACILLTHVTSDMVSL